MSYDEINKKEELANIINGTYKIKSINIFNNNLIYNENNDKLSFMNVSYEISEGVNKEVQYYINTNEWIELSKLIQKDSEKYKNIINKLDLSILEGYKFNNSITEKSNTVNYDDLLLEYTEENGSVKLDNAKRITDVIINKYQTNDNKEVEGISFTSKSKGLFKKEIQNVTYDKKSCDLLKKIVLMKNLTDYTTRILGTHVPSELKMNNAEFCAIYPLQKYLNMKVYKFENADLEQLGWYEENNLANIKIVEDFSNEFLVTQQNILNNFISNKKFENYIKEPGDVLDFFCYSSDKINEDIKLPNTINSEKNSDNEVVTETKNLNNLNKSIDINTSFSTIQSEKEDVSSQNKPLIKEDLINNNFDNGIKKTNENLSQSLLNINIAPKIHTNTLNTKSMPSTNVDTEVSELLKQLDIEYKNRINNKPQSKQL